VGSIENQQLKDFAAQKSNTLIYFFKNKIQSGPTAMLIFTNKSSAIIMTYCFGKDQDKLDYKLSTCCNPFLEIKFLVCIT
jgi:GTP pyrophosphokinase